jgi:PAS domain S-box-containing protein
MKKARILIVEDEPVVSRDIRLQLLELNYEPVADTRTAEDAILLSEQLQPDLVLMDIQLAGAMNGIAAARTIRERFAIPVVFLTAFASELLVDQAKQSEPFGYIIKPYDDRDLRIVIEMALYRHEAEVRRRENFEEHAAILRTALDGYWLVDRAGRILDVNDACCRMHGYTREEMLQRAISDFEADENSAEIETQIQQLLRDGSGRFERRHRCKDGSLVDVEISTNFRPGFGGRFIAFLRDVTARKQAAEAQRRSESRLRQAQKILGLGVWDWDIATDHTNWSDEMFRMYGIAPESFSGRWLDYLECAHPDDRPIQISYIREALRRSGVGTNESASAADAPVESGPVPRQFRIIRPDGSICWVEGDTEAMVNQAGEPVAIVGTLVDITARKLLEAKFQQAQKMEVVGQLAGGVAHDFNNILTAMMLNLEILRSTSLVPEAGSPLHELEAMVKRAAKLTQQLLMFARRQAIRATTLELNGALSNLLKMLRRLLSEDISLKFVTSSPSLWVEVDSGMLDQAVMNLCINARDAMPNGGTLTLATGLVKFDAESARAMGEARPGSFVCLRVSDTGCGMTAEVLRHMFEPFYTTKEVGKGTGLGLASVHGIVHQHQGWVNVESTVGQGTTFRIYLPFSKPAPLPAPVPVPEVHNALSKKGGSETILLVEDETVVRKVSTMMLQKLGYRVLVAVDGQEALRLWQEQAGAVDLLLTDMVMPGGMTGMELGEILRRTKPALKIVLMSGYSEEIIKSEAWSSAGATFLAKPFESKTLAAAIRQSLDGDRPKAV